MDGKYMSVYLAGYIEKSVIDQCIAWRKKIRTTYDNWKGVERYPIIFLDPCNGEDWNEIAINGNNKKIPDHAIVSKDRMCVNNADLIIANMDTFGQTRPPIGTISEIVWASEFHKPIITITDDPLYENHPFIKTFTSWYVKSVDELLDEKIINQFYKSWTTAIY